MIKTHPTALMLRAFAADELPLPLAVGVSAHCELCPDCAPTAPPGSRSAKRSWPGST